MTIKQFDETTLVAIRNDINAAMEAVKSKYGIKLDIGNISYARDMQSFHTKLSALIPNENVPNDVDQKWITDFNRYSRSLGFEKEDLGRKFKFNNDDFELVGARPRARLPMVIRNVQTRKLVIADAKAIKSAMISA